MILQNHRPKDFFGPEDWIGGDPDDEIAAVKNNQREWDEAYAELSFIGRLRYNLFGWRP